MGTRRIASCISHRAGATSDVAAANQTPPRASVSPGRRENGMGSDYGDLRLTITRYRSQTVLVGWPVIRAWRVVRSSEVRSSLRATNPVCCRLYVPGDAICGDCCVDETEEVPGLVLCSRGRAVAQRRCPMAGGASACAVNDAAWRQWCSLVPLGVRTVVNEYRHSRWQMLRLAARCGAAACELMVSDPVVAWLLGNPERTADASRVAYRLLKQQSPMAVLQWAGFEPTHDAAAIIRKLPAGELNATSVQHLRDVLGGELQSREWANVLPHLTGGVLAVLADERIRRVCTLDLLIDLVERDSATTGLLRRIAHLVSDDGRRPIPVFRSASELRTWFEATVASRRAAAEQARLHALAELDRRLRTPVPGTSSIVPLATVNVIVQRLRALKLSLEPVLTDALEGRCAIYRVLEPEEAIAVVELVSRRWRLADVRGARNCAVTTDTSRAVEQWLRKGQSSRREGT